MNKKILAVGGLALVGILGWHFIGKGEDNGEGGLGESLREFGGRAADAGSTIFNLPADTFAGFPAQTPFPGWAKAPEDFYGVTEASAPTKKEATVAAQEAATVPTTLGGKQKAGEWYKPQAGYIPISGTAPAVGKVTVIPDIRPSQYTGASTTLTAGEMAALGITSTTGKGGLTARGEAVKAKAAVRKAASGKKASAPKKTPSSGYAAALARSG